MPEGGKTTSVRTKKLFKRLELHALGLLDLFCVKLYAGRERDRADITNMLEDTHKTKRYYHRYRKELKALLTKYLEHNTQKAPYVIKLYNHYQEKHAKTLLPLDEETLNTYGVKK